MPCLTWNTIPAAHPCWPWKGPLLEPECCVGDSSHGTGSTGRLAELHPTVHPCSWSDGEAGSPGRALQSSTGQCQTRSSRALMAKRVIPACLQLHPQWKDPKQQCRTHVFTVLWGFPCQLCPSPGQQHPQDAAGRAGWGQAPSGATVHMCHRLDTRRTDWKPPMEPPWRYLGFLGLSSRLSGTQRGSDRSSREHSPQPRQRILPAGLPLFGALLSLRTARHRREHQGLGIVALNCLHTCKEYGISGLFHLRFLPTQPSRMLSVELKFRETRRRNWLSLAPTAEDTETKKTSFGNPREMGFHTNLSHRRIFAQPRRSAAARPGTGAAGCSALRSYLGDVPARAREDQPVLG